MPGTGGRSEKRSVLRRFERVDLIQEDYDWAIRQCLLALRAATRLSGSLEVVKVVLERRVVLRALLASFLKVVLSVETKKLGR